METKKKYTKPEFHEVNIDRDISLVMMSTTGGAPPTEPENAMYTDTQTDDPFASPFE